MATDFRHEYRVWRVAWFADGTSEAAVWHHSDVVEAKQRQRQWAAGGWEPPGTVKSHVSAVQVWRRSGNSPWSPYADAVEGTSPAWLGAWDWDLEEDVA